MNDNRNRDAKLVQQAIDMKLTLAEIRTLIAKRPDIYAPLQTLVTLAAIRQGDLT